MQTAKGVHPKEPHIVINYTVRLIIWLILISVNSYQRRQ
jgi:hypothetical protein